ncbi:glycosyltransferase family 22 protein [Tortispora caseinolytica NRRL Y-17796]|uniref:Mannosyltransferase n=1 Tax=Tortispora caseinolytica NRRL Y-17796 TaxID=767744 RepID=A0A1E4TKX6_9ASCO|nr:glycosyltransferase family 22 protein [Tortispora caseinolytica NRRL Y-17796]
MGVSGLDLQAAARACLGAFNAIGMIYFYNTVKTVYNASTANWYILLQLSQFHMIFYASRTLPNFMAFPFVWISLALLLKNKHKRAISLLVFAGVTLRAELLALAGTITLATTFDNYKKLKLLIKTAAITGIAASFVTVAIDSYFWRQPFIFPELYSFLFNIVAQKNNEWGVQPFGAYFQLYLPLLLANPATLALAVFSVTRNSKLNRLIYAATAYTALYSFIGHKEWRFIVYIVPIITLAAADGVQSVPLVIPGASGQRLFKPVLAAVTGLAFIASLFKAYASSYNYPGGYALQAVNQMAPAEMPVAVYMDVFTCMTGATKFGQSNEPTWTYYKTEKEEDFREEWNKGLYDFALVSAASEPYALILNSTDSWVLRHIVIAMHGVSIDPLKQFAQQILTERSFKGYETLVDRTLTLGDSIYVYERVHSAGDISAWYCQQCRSKDPERIVAGDAGIANFM